MTMKPARKQRLTLIGLMVLGIGIAVGFGLKAFNEKHHVLLCSR